MQKFYKVWTQPPYYFVLSLLAFFHSSGWIVNEKHEVFIYYASSDTRMHVATSTVDKLIDYCKHTPEDGLRSAASVQTRNQLISANLKILQDIK